MKSRRCSSKKQKHILVSKNDVSHQILTNLGIKKSKKFQKINLAKEKYSNSSKDKELYGLVIIIVVYKNQKIRA